MHKEAEASAEPVVYERETKTTRFTNALLKRLESLNNRLAREEGIPQYAIFPKGTLKEIAETLPFTIEDIGRLTGVGKYKAEKYGSEFVDEVRAYMGDQDIIKKPKGLTYVETLRLFRQGLTVEEIAMQRSMAVSTIASHISKMYMKGEDIDLLQFLHPGDLVLAKQGWRASGFSDQTSKIKEQVGDSLDYTRLNFAMAILRREQEIAAQNDDTSA